MTFQPDPLVLLLRMKENREDNETRYAHWLKKCVEAGYSNRHIARELGLTEAAIRMYRKRHDI